MAGEVRQRYMQANYIAVGAADSTYVLMGAGFSELNESPSAQTSSKRYINDKALTKRVSGYDWSSPFTTDQIRSEAKCKGIFLKCKSKDCKKEFELKI